MFSRKTAIVCAAAAASLVMFAGAAGAAVTWNTQIVRNGSDVNSTPPTIAQNGLDGVTTEIWIANQKTAFTTDYFDGQSLSTVDKVTYNRVDSGSTTASPYVNIWVTDGTREGTGRVAWGKDRTLTASQPTALHRFIDRKSVV